jgi:hypothetical protein
MRQVIYHASCWDGFCCAWLCHIAWPNAEFVQANYGWSPPDVSGKDLLIADFSYPRDVLIEMSTKAKSIKVLDHHETAEEALHDLSFCVFDMDRSGGRLTWEYLLAEGHLKVKHRWQDLSYSCPHWLVRYTEDRDLWRHALPHSREINAALRSYSLDFQVWDTLADRSPESFLAEGTGIVRYTQGVIDHHLRYLQWVEIDGVRGKGVSCSTAHIWSEMMEQIMLKEPNLPFVVVWQDTVDGLRLYSIRTPKYGSHHANQIAKKMGGGGHTHSSAFNVNIRYELSKDKGLIPIHSKVEKPHR